MKYAWYPLQLFVRKWEVVVPVGITAALVVVIAGWLEYALSHVPQPVFLHYSVELGVDSLGSPHTALVLPGILLLILIINTTLANVLWLSTRPAARVVLWSSVPLAMIAFWFAILIARVNGA
ncbi:MAG: hypothetical protein NT003_04890 [Candidatus Magasanikbacteria bacterium]|nr:hypothetical protein [Candidatus Magasanikbacteria bacterium]